MPASVVIAVAGPSGAGKSALLWRLASLLGAATALQFDDYRALTTWPDDWATWLANGADPSAVQTPRFAADVRRLRMGADVTHPDGATILQPHRFLVLEEPFGRARPEMASLIDYVVGIDLPLEVALARRLRALIGSRRPQAPAEQILQELDQYLEQYLAVLHEGYRAIQARALQSSDLVVDGRRSTEELANQVATVVQRRFPAAL